MVQCYYLIPPYGMKNMIFGVTKSLMERNIILMEGGIVFIYPSYGL